MGLETSKTNRLRKEIHMLKCQKCGKPLDIGAIEVIVKCTCGALNRVVGGKVVGLVGGVFAASGKVVAISTEDTVETSETSVKDVVKVSVGNVEAGDAEIEPVSYQGKAAEEKTVKAFLKSYRGIYRITNLSDTLQAFCAFSGLAPESVIPRGRFKRLWDQSRSIQHSGKDKS